jgi:hypothetical protein
MEFNLPRCHCVKISCDGRRGAERDAACRQG